MERIFKGPLSESVPRMESPRSDEKIAVLRLDEKGGR